MYAQCLGTRKMSCVLLYFYSDLYRDLLFNCVLSPVFGVFHPKSKLFKSMFETYFRDFPFISSEIQVDFPTLLLLMSPVHRNSIF